MAKMHMYLVTLVSRDDGRQQKIRVRTECNHEWHEWVAQCNRDGWDPPLEITNPTLLSVDPDALAHMDANDASDPDDTVGITVA